MWLCHFFVYYKVSLIQGKKDSKPNFTPNGGAEAHADLSPSPQVSRVAGLTVTRTDQLYPHVLVLTAEAGERQARRSQKAALPLPATSQGLWCFFTL